MYIFYPYLVICIVLVCLVNIKYVYYLTFCRPLLFNNYVVKILEIHKIAFNLILLIFICIKRKEKIFVDRKGLVGS